MQAVYDAKKRVMLEDKKSQTPQAPGTFSDDKWNPGDIWLSSFPMKSQPLQESNTWAELNQKVLDFAGELKKQPKTSLLGVSLKKLADTGGKVDRYNSSERKHNVNVKFKGFRLYFGYFFYTHRSTSPKTISNEPSTAGTSANIWPFIK